MEYGMRMLFKQCLLAIWPVRPLGLTVLLAFVLSCEMSTVRAPHLCYDGLETAYMGSLPCPDCRFIETILELRFNQTFIMSTRYIGKEDDIQFEERGKFNWIGDGTYIHLIDYEGPSYFKVDTGSVIQVSEKLEYFEDPEFTRYRLVRYPMGVSPE